MSFPSPITSLNLRVTQGSTTFEQSIPSASVGSNAVLVTDTNIINAFNNQPPGTIFNPSIVTTYDAGSFPSGDTLPTTSVSNFVPRPLILSNFGPFSYDFVSGGSGTFTLPEPSSNSNSPGEFTYTSSNTSVVTVLSTRKVWTMTRTSSALGNFNLNLTANNTDIALHIDFRSDRVLLHHYTNGAWDRDEFIIDVFDFHNLPLPTVFTVTFDTTNFKITYGPSNQVLTYPNYLNVASINGISDTVTFLSNVIGTATVQANATIVGAGTSTITATIVGAGTSTITATQAAAGGYTSAYVEAIVTIAPIAPTFSNGGVFTISSKNFGDASFTPDYPTSNSSGAFTYTSSTPSVATVNSTTGLVTIVSIGTTTIRATQAAAVNYTSAYVEASVTIAPIAPTFSNGGVFTISSKDLGDDPFTPAYPTSNSSGAFTYTSSAPSVATVNSTTGLVTIVSVGTTTIRSTQAAAGNYTSAYIEASFSVMTWSQRGLDINGEASGDNSGRSVSLSSSGNTLAIGALLNNGNGSNAGHARVYDWSGSAWTQRGSDIDGEAAGDYSGISVSLSSNGNIVAIGALYNDDAASNAGHVRVYYWDTVAIPNNWTKLGSDIDGEADEDNIGVSVSLSSDGYTLAVGAMYNDGSITNAGHVRVYDWNTVAWTKRGSDIDGEGINDNSGVSVSLSSDGNTVAIGARYNDGSFSNAGHVRVHDWNGSSWTKRGLDIDGETAGDNSGWSVSLSSDGNTVAIGARANDASGNLLLDAGHVRIYDWDIVAIPNKWTKRGLDIDGVKAGDNDGFSVSLSSDGNIVAIGGPYNDGSGNLLPDAGHARVYYWDTVNTPNKWTQRGSDIYGEAAGDYSGWSVSLSSDGNTVAIGATLNDSSFSNAGHVRVFKYE